MLHPKQALQAAGRKVANMLARGIVKLINDAGGTQLLQLSLMADETRSDLEHPQEYGFTSNANAGAEAIVAFFGGNRDHGTVLTVFDKRYRVKSLQSGEVCIYDDLGTKILLKRGNQIEITASTSVKLITPKTYLTGDLEVTGYIKATGDITDNTATNSRSMAGTRTVYNTHTHPENGGTTSAPNQSM